jgi:hypothetical protein
MLRSRFWKQGERREGNARLSERKNEERGHRVTREGETSRRYGRKNYPGGRDLLFFGEDHEMSGARFRQRASICVESPARSRRMIVVSWCHIFLAQALSGQIQNRRDNPSNSVKPVKTKKGGAGPNHMAGHYGPALKRNHAA